MRGTPRYIVTENHELTVLDEDGMVLWCGKPNNLDVDSALPIPDAPDCIVLLDWRRSTGSNLLRMGPDGSVIWRASHPLVGPYGVSTSFDAYVRISDMRQSTLGANSYSGFLDTIDLATGRAIASEFAK